MPAGQDVQAAWQCMMQPMTVLKLVTGMVQSGKLEEEEQERMSLGTHVMLHAWPHFSQHDLQCLQRK